MNSKVLLLALLILVLGLSFGQKVNSGIGGSGGDILQETPLYPVPKDMTFKEYRDMNRRISVGLMLSAIPIPGAIHKYAGEDKTAKCMRWIGLSGLALVIAGATMDGKDQAKEENLSYDQILIDGINYYQIPVSSTSIDGTTTVDYKLKAVKEREKGNATVIVLGIGVLVVNYMYDYLHGIQVIEEKRDRVRFKYGKSLDFGLYPGYDHRNQTASINLYCDF